MKEKASGMKEFALREWQLKNYLPYDGHLCPSYLSVDLEFPHAVSSYLPLALSPQVSYRKVRHIMTGCLIDAHAQDD